MTDAQAKKQSQHQRDARSTKHSNTALPVTIKYHLSGLCQSLDVLFSFFTDGLFFLCFHGTAEVSTVMWTAGP